MCEVLHGARAERPPALRRHIHRQPLLSEQVFVSLGHNSVLLSFSRYRPPPAQPDVGVDHWSHRGPRCECRSRCKPCLDPVPKGSCRGRVPFAHLRCWWAHAVNELGNSYLSIPAFAGASKGSPMAPRPLGHVRAVQLHVRCCQIVRGTAQPPETTGAPYPSSQSLE